MNKSQFPALTYYRLISATIWSFWPVSAACHYNLFYMQAKESAVLLSSVGLLFSKSLTPGSYQYMMIDELQIGINLRIPVMKCFFRL